MPSMKDVAARAGVSAATASRALSGNGPVSAKARARVLTAAEDLDFVPSFTAASLASGRSRNIGVIVPSIDRWFFAKVVRGIAGEVFRVGYDLTLYNTEGSSEHQESVLRDFLRRKRLDAVITVSLQLDEDEIRQLKATGRPTVGVGGPMPGVRTISVDNFDIGVLATEHLLGLGHRSIGHLAGGRDPYRDFDLSRSRQGGFKAAIERAGIEVRPQWIVMSDFTMGDAYRQATAMLGSGERPTAIFCASDEIAVGTLQAARTLGLRVPEDLSLIGVDGAEVGEVFGITTIAQDPAHQGELAARRLLAQLADGENDGHSQHELLEARLVVRRSTMVRPAV